MPDPTLQSVSASQMPALLGHSPYGTPRMLYEHFVNAFDLDTRGDERMNWGNRLAPAIMKWAADELRMDVVANDDDKYLRHPDLPLGCTPDGFVLDPQRGLGWIEAKNVDWLRWKQTWQTNRAPNYVELQLQHQLLIPHPEHGQAKWGAIAVLIGGNDPNLLMREPIPEVGAQIIEAAQAFLGDAVKNQTAPDWTGEPIELPALNAAYPTTEDKIIDVRDTDEDEEMANMLQMFQWAKEQGSMADKLKKEYQAKLLTRMQDAAELRCTAFLAKLSKSDIAATTVERKAYVRNSVTLKRFDSEITNRPSIMDEDVGVGA